MRPQLRAVGTILLVALLLASVGVWVFARHPVKSPATSGAEVTGLVQRPSNPRFVSAWQFVNFVSGREPAPAFSPRVTLVIDGKTHVLTGTQAKQRSTWRGTPLDLYTVAKGYTLREGGHVTPASLRMFVDSGRDFVCGGQELPPRLRSTPSLWLGLVPSGPGVPGSCTFLNVFVTDGRIDTLVARTSRTM